MITTSRRMGLVVGNACFIGSCTGMTELNANYYVVGTTPTTTTLTLTDAGRQTPSTTTSFGTYTGTAGRLYQAGVPNNLFATGGANTITWTPVTDADTYNVLLSFRGGLYGYIGQTAGTLVHRRQHRPGPVEDAADLRKRVFRYRRLPGRRGLRTAAGVRRHRQRPAKFWMTRSGASRT